MAVACAASWDNPSDTGNKGQGVEGNPLQLFLIGSQDIQEGREGSLAPLARPSRHEQGH